MIHKYCIQVHVLKPLEMCEQSFCARWQKHRQKHLIARSWYIYKPACIMGTRVKTKRGRCVNGVLSCSLPIRTQAIIVVYPRLIPFPYSTLTSLCIRNDHGLTTMTSQLLEMRLSVRYTLPRVVRRLPEMLRTGHCRLKRHMKNWHCSFSSLPLRKWHTDTRTCPARLTIL